MLYVFISRFISYCLPPSVARAHAPLMDYSLCVDILLRKSDAVDSFEGPDFEVQLPAAAQSTPALNLPPSTTGSQTQ
jgi:hypothetical protein